MNNSHLHIDPDTGREVDVFGQREHCNVCRKAKGLKELTETELKLMQQAATSGAGSGSEPVEQLLADLQDQEAVNDELRAQLKAKDAELAQLRQQLAAGAKAKRE